MTFAESIAAGFDAVADQIKSLQNAGSLIAYTENNTGNLTTLVGASNNVAIDGVNIFVPPTTKDVWLEWSGTIGITTPGQGAINLVVYDFSTGFAGLKIVGAAITCFLTATPIGVNRATPFGQLRVGPSSSSRVYYLAAILSPEGSNLAGNIANGSQGVYSRSYLAAVAR